MSSGHEESPAKDALAACLLGMREILADWEAKEQAGYLMRWLRERGFEIVPVYDESKELERLEKAMRDEQRS